MVCSRSIWHEVQGTLVHFALLFPLLAAGCCCLNQQVGYQRNDQFVDEHRMEILALLQTVKVGELPQGNLTLVPCLAHFNHRVEAAGLPDTCLLVLKTPPDCLTDRYPYTAWQVSDRFVLSETDVFRRMKWDTKQSLRQGLAEMNLRQFLWFLVRGYLMDIHFDRTRIVVGYGWAGEEGITPD